MAWHPTEVILHPEPVETGDAQEQVPTLQMEAEVTEKTKNISMQELLIQEAWCRWEESLRMAHRMQRVREAALLDELTWEPSIHVRRLMQEEWENLENGKSDFWESQQVLKKMEWRWMILDWMNGTSDDCGGRKFP